MTPRVELHTHSDPVCGLAWPCANPHCVDPDERWCGKPPCYGEPGLHQLTRLTDIGHALHMAEQDYRHVFSNTVMAGACAELRAQLLTLVDDAAHVYRSTR